VVAENNQATGLWAWLKGHGLRDVSRMQVLDIAWFTDSMKAGRPVTMETRHHIQVSGLECTMSVNTVRCVFSMCLSMCGDRQVLEKELYIKLAV